MRGEAGNFSKSDSQMIHANGIKIFSGIEDHSQPPKDFGLDDACKVFQRWTGSRCIGRVFLNRRILAKLFRDRRGCRYCVLFKRDFYHKFSKHFPNVPYKGFGQVFSLALLERLEKIGVDNLVLVMPYRNGYVGYKASVKQILEFYHQYKTKVPHLEETVAFPASFLKRFFPQRGLVANG